MSGCKHFLFLYHENLNNLKYLGNVKELDDKQLLITIELEEIK